MRITSIGSSTDLDGSTPLKLKIQIESEDNSGVNNNSQILEDKTKTSAFDCNTATSLNISRVNQYNFENDIEQETLLISNPGTRVDSQAKENIGRELAVPFESINGSDENQRREFIPYGEKKLPEAKIRENRELWSNKCEFLLAVIGYAVDLSNVWR